MSVRLEDAASVAGVKARAQRMETSQPLTSSLACVAIGSRHGRHMAEG
jgi:hypothetical protein